jgi:hypothetical protein
VPIEEKVRRRETHDTVPSDNVKYLKVIWRVKQNTRSMSRYVNSLLEDTVCTEYINVSLYSVNAI